MPCDSEFLALIEGYVDARGGRWQRRMGSAVLPITCSVRAGCRGGQCQRFHRPSGNLRVVKMGRSRPQVKSQVPG
jgi:hypothetical protein